MLVLMPQQFCGLNPLSWAWSFIMQSIINAFKDFDFYVQV